MLNDPFRDGSKGGKMSRHDTLNRHAPQALAVVTGLICLCLVASAAPIEFESEWVVDEGPCIAAGDVPICESASSFQESMAIGGIHLVVNQDSPLFGKTSRGEKQIRFQRTFSADAPVKVALFAELTGTLRIGGGRGEVVVRATALVVDAASYVPVAGMEIDSSTVPESFSHTVVERGITEVQDSGVQVATLPAGEYIVVGSIEATAEMARGWWNREAEADVSLNIEFLTGSDESAIPEVDASSLDQTDFIVVPLG
jgi:hypothetical protein